MQHATITLVDDIDHTTEAVETIPFGLDGIQYSIDLNSEHAAELRGIFQDCITRGRRVGGRRKSPTRFLTRRISAASEEADTAEAGRLELSEPTRVRAWAAENGIMVRPAGRIKQSVVDEYRRQLADSTGHARTAKGARSTSKGQ